MSQPVVPLGYRDAIYYRWVVEVDFDADLMDIVRGLSVVYNDIDPDPWEKPQESNMPLEIDQRTGKRRPEREYFELWLDYFHHRITLVPRNTASPMWRAVKAAPWNYWINKELWNDLRWSKCKHGHCRNKNYCPCLCHGKALRKWEHPDQPKLRADLGTLTPLLRLDPGRISVDALVKEVRRGNRDGFLDEARNRRYYWFERRVRNSEFLGVVDEQNDRLYEYFADILDTVTEMVEEERYYDARIKLMREVIGLLLATWWWIDPTPPRPALKLPSTELAVVPKASPYGMEETPLDMDDERIGALAALTEKIHSGDLTEEETERLEEELLATHAANWRERFSQESERSRHVGNVDFSG